ncbi:MAG: hypothetical protein NVS3B20_25500 [Polyangiales bacterium]
MSDSKHNRRSIGEADEIVPSASPSCVYAEGIDPTRSHSHDHAHDHPHDHPFDAHADGDRLTHGPRSAEARAASKLPWILFLTLAFFGVELTAARYAHSESLRADAIHLLADVLAIGIAYTAFRLSDLRPNARFTFGLRRIEAVAALINAMLVLGGAAEIIHEGIEALSSKVVPRTGIMLAVSAAALVVHGMNATLLHRDLHGHSLEGQSHHSSPHIHALPTGRAVSPNVTTRLSVRGAWLHVMGDALGALFALSAAVAIHFGAPREVDPIASFFVAALLVTGGLRLVREATLVLLEAAPKHLPVGAIEEAVCDIEGIDCVHRLRVWTLGTGYDAIALHVTATRHDLGLARLVEARLRARFHVDYVCVQVDAPSNSVGERERGVESQ